MAGAFNPLVFNPGVYSWGPPPSVVSAAPLATTRSLLGGLYDQLLDPVTLDFVDDDDGGWLETADSRSIVMCQLDLELGASTSTPRDGTRIAELMRTGEPVTPELVVAEYQRAFALLERDGVISDLTIEITDEQGNLLVEDGRFTPVLHWRDLASGSPVDLAYAPVGG